MKGRRSRIRCNRWEMKEGKNFEMIFDMFLTASPLFPFPFETYSLCYYSTLRCIKCIKCTSLVTQPVNGMEEEEYQFFLVIKYMSLPIFLHSRLEGHELLASPRIPRRG